MARVINKLTDKTLQSLLKNGPTAISDGGGLTFTVSKAGYAAWVFRYRLGGKQKELSLGSYHALTLQEARVRASAAKADVFSLKDVALIKQDDKRKQRSIVTFKELVLDYQERAMDLLAPSTIKQRNQHFKTHVIPTLGTIPCGEVTPSHIADMVRKVGKKSTPNVAELVLTATSEAFRHGQSIGAVDLNPCYRLQASAITGKPQIKRKRLMLSERELRELLPNLSLLGPQNALAVKILLATCCRIGELAKAEWKHVDLSRGTWTIPTENSKNSREFHIPLPPPVIAWFRELEVFAMGSNFVLPARQTRRAKTHGKPMHYEQRALNSMLNKVIPKLKGVRHFTPHDLRSTARSHLSQMGVGIVVAERCLNHSLGGIIEVYDQHDYFEERRLALNTLTSFLVACEKNQPWTNPNNLSHLRLVA